MDYPWFRLYSNIVHDPKILCLTLAQRWYWVGLMALANASPARGRLEVAPGRPYNVRDVAMALYAAPEEIEEALHAYADLSMVHIEEDKGRPVIVISDWEKRQYESSTLRVQKHRRAALQEGAASDPGKAPGSVADFTPGTLAKQQDELAAGVAPPGNTSNAPSSTAHSAPCNVARSAACNAPSNAACNDHETLLKQQDVVTDAASRGASARTDPDTDTETDTDPESRMMDRSIYLSLSCPINLSSGPHPPANNPQPNRRAGILPATTAQPQPNCTVGILPAAASPGEEESPDPAPEDPPAEEDPDADGQAPEGEDSSFGHSLDGIDSKIARCTEEWAPAEDSKTYIHELFRIWNKSGLSLDRFERVVAKAIEVTQRSIDKNQVRTGSYMQYMLSVLRNDLRQRRRLCEPARGLERSWSEPDPDSRS